MIDKALSLYPTIATSVVIAFFYEAISTRCGADKQKVNQLLNHYYQALSKDTSMLNQTLVEDVSSRKADQLLIKDILHPSHSTEALLYYYNKTPLFADLENYGKFYYTAPDGKKYYFSDCMENSIANFIRILSYDIRKRSYTLDTLQNNLSKPLSETARQRLKKFISNPTDHECWINLVENIAFTPYIKTPNIGKDESTKAYMPINNQKDEQNIRSMGYTPLFNDYAYELETSPRSLIMVLNYIFDLNVIDLDASNIARKDFVSHYFTIINSIFNMQFEYQNNEDYKIDNQDINQYIAEGKEINILITNTFNNQENIKNIKGFNKFFIRPGHAEYTFVVLSEENNTSKKQ